MSKLQVGGGVLGGKALIAMGEPGEGGRPGKWENLGPFVPPSLTEGTMHYFIPCEDTRGWREGVLGDRVQKTSKIQKKPPNLTSNGMEKGWGGVWKAM